MTCLFVSCPLCLLRRPLILRGCVGLSFVSHSVVSLSASLRDRLMEGFMSPDKSRRKQLYYHRLPPAQKTVIIQSLPGNITKNIEYGCISNTTKCCNSWVFFLDRKLHTLFNTWSCLLLLWAFLTLHLHLTRFHAYKHRLTCIVNLTRSLPLFVRSGGRLSKLDYARLSGHGAVCGLWAGLGLRLVHHGGWGIVLGIFQGLQKFVSAGRHRGYTRDNALSLTPCNNVDNPTQEH